jgi:PadR family transcriptional regulator, regulatory protein PadR
MDIEKEMLKGYIDLIILSLLLSEDLYGYELAKRVKEKTGNTFEMKEGTLYLSFKRMEQAGLISSYWGDENTGGRRRYYKLLATGKKHLQERKKEWTYLKKIIDMFLGEV